ncbi:MAG: flagellar motor switch protein FliM, partial [Novosphingobium sp.]|nr:flagellar motor switch protein FliM [Novosphingobium sp.]
MKPERRFVADRPVARHCRELIPAQARADDSSALLKAYGERLADALASGLARLVGGEKLKVQCSSPHGVSLHDLFPPEPQLAAWSLLDAGQPDAWVLARIDGAAILSLVDRAFGGAGTLPAALPDSFPLSADLFISRIEEMIVAALSAAVSGSHKPALRIAARESDPSRLAGLAGDEAVELLELEIRQEEQPGWKLLLALPCATRALLAGKAPAAAFASAGTLRLADPAQEPFASLPLCVRAVLVDMRIAFARLASLRPGDVLPVAVVRKV